VAAGHRARFRWRLGTDCAGGADAASGWSIDSVRLTSAAPSVSAPAKLAVTAQAGAHGAETLDVGNAGSGSLDYAVTVGSADCSAPANPAWLRVDAGSGVLVGGESRAVALAVDVRGLAAGDYAASLCIASNDAAQPLRTVPLRLTVTADACAAADRVFANGFDDAGDGRCSETLRSYDDRTTFLARVGNGYDVNTFTNLRTGDVHTPLRFDRGAYAYTVTVASDVADDALYLFAGAGVLSAVSPDPSTEFTLTFSGAPVTALGGNFWGQMFQDPTSVVMNLQVPTTIVLTLDDGTVETFVADDQQAFRGFVASKPIARLKLRAPDPNADGAYAWAVFDNLIVGSAR
jgi:hypothetical protein